VQLVIFLCEREGGHAVTVQLVIFLCEREGEHAVTVQLVIFLCVREDEHAVTVQLVRSFLSVREGPVMYFCQRLITIFDL